MGKGRKAGKQKSLPVSIGIGISVSLLLTLIAAFMLAILIESGKISVKAMGYGVMIMLMTSSFLGAIIASRQIISKTMIVSIITSTCYFIALLCTTALFFDGMYRGIPATALVVFAGGLIAGLLPKGQGGATKMRKRKKRYS